MKYFWLVFSLNVAFFLELTLSARVSFWGFGPPLVAATLIFWFWNMGLTGRFWLGVALGFLLDSFFPVSFGTYVVLFSLLGLFVEILQQFFSNIESVLTRSIGLGFSLSFFLSLITPVSWFLQYLQGASSLFPARSLVYGFLVSFLWALVGASIFWGVTYLKVRLFIIRS